jgi:hypothetical protein
LKTRLSCPTGRTLVTLYDAAQYIIALSPRRFKQERWQIAMRCLIDAADNGGIPMMARLAFVRALRRL